jgi:hypothetical protein
MSTYAVNIDWHEEFKNNFDKWENVGRHTIEDSCTHKTQDKDSDENNREPNVRYSGYCEECEISEDDCQPMMNYAYPLHHCLNDEEIVKIVKNTCLTVMHNTETGNYFLVLCGGGMDLSQQIGLAYIFAEHWIPEDLIGEISIQKGLSVGGKGWKLLRSKIIAQLKEYSDRAKQRAEEWERTDE